jgi:hypothetical protein
LIAFRQEYAVAARKAQKSKDARRQLKPLLDDIAPPADSPEARVPRKNPRWLLLSIVLFVAWLGFLIYTALWG